MINDYIIKFDTIFVINIKKKIFFYIQIRKSFIREIIIILKNINEITLFN